MADIFKLVGSIFVDTDKANDSLSKTDKKASGVGETLSKVGGTAAKAGAAIVGGATAAVGGIIDLAKETASTADVIDKASIRMGISAEAYQEYSYAAGLAGVETSTLEKAAKKLEGTDINFDDAIDQIMSMESAEERSAKAAELFGDSIAYQLSPMIEQSKESFEGAIQEANELGLVMSGEDVAAGAAMNDTFSKITETFSMLATNLGTSLMPLVQEFADKILEWMPTIQELFNEMTPIIQDLFAQLMPPIMELLEQLLPPLMALIKALLPLLTIIAEPLIKLINNVLPPVINLIATIVTWLAEKIPTAISKCKSFFETFGTTIKNVFERIKSAVKTPVNAVLGFINGLIRGVTGGINSIIRALNRLQINVPSWVTKLTGVSSFGFNLGEVSAPQIPLLAKGGVLDGGSAIVGEDGPELLQTNGAKTKVTPLNDNNNEFVELNEKLDELISLFKNGMGVYINGGALVGQLAPEIDRSLGRLSVKNNRGVYA